MKDLTDTGVDPTEGDADALGCLVSDMRSFERDTEEGNDPRFCLSVEDVGVILTAIDRLQRMHDALVAARTSLVWHIGLNNGMSMSEFETMLEKSPGSRPLVIRQIDEALEG